MVLAVWPPVAHTAAIHIAVAATADIEAIQTAALPIARAVVQWPTVLAVSPCAVPTVATDIAVTAIAATAIAATAIAITTLTIAATDITTTVIAAIRAAVSPTVHVAAPSLTVLAVLPCEGHGAATPIAATEEMDIALIDARLLSLARPDNALRSFDAGQNQ
jgi:hypothetical protein